MVNLFYLSDNPTECVKYYHDKQVRIMYAEIAMILYAIHGELDDVESPYKKPINLKLNICKWIKKSRQNYLYAANVGQALLNENLYRFGWQNKVYQERYDWLLNHIPSSIPDVSMTPFCLSKNVEVYHKYFDVLDACRLSFVDYKLNNERQWSKRGEPNWIGELVSQSKPVRQSLCKAIREKYEDDSLIKSELEVVLGRNYQKNTFMYGKMFDFNRPIVEQLGIGHLMLLAEVLGIK